VGWRRTAPDRITGSLTVSIDGDRGPRALMNGSGYATIEGTQRTSDLLADAPVSGGTLRRMGTFGPISAVPRANASYARGVSGQGYRGQSSHSRFLADGRFARCVAVCAVSALQRSLVLDPASCCATDRGTAMQRVSGLC
jgi:hypothetical protein